MLGNTVVEVTKNEQTDKKFLLKMIIDSLDISNTRRDRYDSLYFIILTKLMDYTCIFLFDCNMVHLLYIVIKFVVRICFKIGNLIKLPFPKDC
jgi:hypothetical protein